MESVKVAYKVVKVPGFPEAVQVSWRGVSVLGYTKEKAIVAFEQNTGMIVKNK